ncbi:ArsI/CadI family heavy metal resistance metalloenzyme [Aurantivibrio plasticivorans]
MKRLHVHIGVDNLDESIRFYSALFGAEPTTEKEDYAKWMLDDPRVNFAISTRGRDSGIDHLGIQVDDAEELTDIRQRLENADMSLFDEGETVCCYAKSDKSWVKDPAGVAWEAYQTMEQVQYFNEAAEPAAGACCVPKEKPVASCSTQSTSGTTGGCC